MQRLLKSAKNGEHAACEKEVNYLSQFYFINYAFVASQNHIHTQLEYWKHQLHTTPVLQNTKRYCELKTIKNVYVYS